MPTYKRITELEQLINAFIESECEDTGRLELYLLELKKLQKQEAAIYCMK